MNKSKQQQQKASTTKKKETWKKNKACVLYLFFLPYEYPTEWAIREIITLFNATVDTLTTLLLLL